MYFFDKLNFDTSNYDEYINFLDSYICFDIKNTDNTKINSHKLYSLLENTQYILTLYFTNNSSWNILNYSISGHNRYLISNDNTQPEIYKHNNKIYIKILPKNHIDELKKTWTERDNNDDIIKNYKFTYNLIINQNLIKSLNLDVKISLENKIC